MVVMVLTVFPAGFSQWERAVCLLFIVDLRSANSERIEALSED